PGDPHPARGRTVVEHRPARPPAPRRHAERGGLGTREPHSREAGAISLTMRCYLSVDMEGIAGIAHPAQCSFEAGGDRTDYDRGRMLMAGEANAAIAAAFDAGADEVLVNDSHWQMRN